jgi:hypothetical protein
MVPHFPLKLRMLLCCVLCSLPSGCGGCSGPELTEVSGTITIQGTSGSRLSVAFYPEAEGGSPSIGSTDKVIGPPATVVRSLWSRVLCPPKCIPEVTPSISSWIS